MNTQKRNILQKYEKLCNTHVSMVIPKDIEITDTNNNITYKICSDCYDKVILALSTINTVKLRYKEVII